MVWIASAESPGRMLENYINSRNFYFLLTNNSTFTKTSSLYDIIKQEIIEANGYSRKLYAPSTGAYDSIQNRYEIPDVDLPLTATGGFLQFDRGVMISSLKTDGNGVSATANKVFTASAATNRLTVSAHGLTDGAKVIPTADPAATLPTGIQSIAYYVGVIDADTVELYSETALTTVAGFTDAGSGTLRLRYADGDFDFFDEYGSTTIPEGREQPITIRWNQGGGNADVEAV